MKKLAGFVFLLTLLFIVTLNLHPTYAQTCGTGIGKATGLVSAPDIGSFSTTGGCVKDPKAAFAPFTIPTYADLKSLYFDRSKFTKDQTTFTGSNGVSATTSFAGDKVYFDSGNLSVSGTPTGSGTQIIFVEGNLNFNSDYKYNPTQGGTTFIVKGNVNILQSVKEIDAVIISEGIICSAFDGTSCPVANVTTEQLVINGSLISLNLTDVVPFKFRRSLADNTTQPAEKIVQQNKYLVLLKDVLSQTVQKWSEVTGDTVVSESPSPTIPTSPTNVATAVTSSNQISVSWQPGSGATSFKVYYCTGASICNPNLLAPNVNANPYSHSSLSCGTTYWYKVIGHNTQGDSIDPGTASAHANTPACAPDAPTLQTPTATNITATTATLNSTVNPNGASTIGFYKYCASGGTCTATTSCPNLPGTQTSTFGPLTGVSNITPNAKTIPSLSPNTTYRFCAVATNSGGTTYGTVQSFTTLVQPPPPPPGGSSAAGIILANPNPCSMSNGSTTCTSHISWSSSNVANAAVHVHPASQVDCAGAILYDSTSGSVDISGIIDSTGYDFDLCGNSDSILLDKVFVQGITQP